MAGIKDKVQGFLASWPIVEKHLNELLQEAVRNGNKLFNSEGGCRIPSISNDHDLSIGREKGPSRI